MARALRGLYREEANQAFFDWAAGTKSFSETAAETVMRQGQLEREPAIGLLQKLAEAGLGTFVVGRRGAKTRIVWEYKLPDIGAAASGAVQHLHKVKDEEVEDGEEEGESNEALMIEHLFNLRTGLRITVSLPRDLTQREAERLARFVEALPLGD